MKILLALCFLSAATSFADDSLEYQGTTGDGYSHIQNANPSHQAWAELSSIKNEFLIPGARVDYLNRFERSELKTSVFSTFKNAKKQSAFVLVGFNPNSKSLSRYSLQLDGKAPVYGKPVEMTLGFKYLSFFHTTVGVIAPGFDAYLLYDFVFTIRLLASKVKLNAIPNDRWQMGYLLKLSKFYHDENLASIYFSKNFDAAYHPPSDQYQLMHAQFLGASAEHWFNKTLGIEPAVEWQKRTATEYMNWVTVKLGLLFRF